MADMTAPASFVQRYGGATANVDYSRGPEKEEEFLPMPQQSDSLATLLGKMRALANVVEKGNSVARWTGYLGTPQGGRDAESVARTRMTEIELEMFDHWKSGGVLPDINWDVDRKKAPSGKDSLARAQRRAAGLNLLYHTDRATAEHVMFFVDQWQPIIPVLSAATKVVSAKIDFLSGQNKLDENEVAEVQTIGKAIGTTYGTINAIQEEVNRILSGINRAKDVMQAREHAIKAKNPDYKKPHSPANDRRELLGKRKIGADVDFSVMPEPARRARRDLAQGIQRSSLDSAIQAAVQTRRTLQAATRQGDEMEEEQ